MCQSVNNGAMKEYFTISQLQEECRFLYNNINNKIKYYTCIEQTLAARLYSEQKGWSVLQKLSRRPMTQKNPNVSSVNI